MGIPQAAARPPGYLSPGPATMARALTAAAAPPAPATRTRPPANRPASAVTRGIASEGVHGDKAKSRPKRKALGTVAGKGKWFHVKRLHRI
jgi:hypothetical protein